MGENLTEHQKYLKRLGVARQGRYGVHPAWLAEEAPERVPLWVAIIPISLFLVIYHFLYLITR